MACHLPRIQTCPAPRGPRRLMRIGRLPSPSATHCPPSGLPGGTRLLGAEAGLQLEAQRKGADFDGHCRIPVTCLEKAWGRRDHFATQSVSSFNRIIVCVAGDGRDELTLEKANGFGQPIEYAVRFPRPLPSEHRCSSRRGGWCLAVSVLPPTLLPQRREEPQTVP